MFFTILLITFNLVLLSMNEDLKNRFNEDGFVVVKDLLKPSEIEFYREVIKEAIKERKLLDERELKDKSIYEQSFIQCQNLWEDYKEIRQLTFHQKICEIAAYLLDENAIRIWHDQALVKESGGRETDPHHDQPYWPIKESKTITAWIPMCEVNENNGQLGFYAGSHKKDDKRFIDIFSGKVDEEEFVKETNLESIKVSYQKMNIGDVSFHHGLTFHRAKPNRSKEDRVVHTAIYFADGCTRGDDKFHFSVDRPNIKVGEMIDSDVTPIAYPIASMPDRPRTSISDEFMAYKMMGLLPKD